jgi:hypothetical protein
MGDLARLDAFSDPAEEGRCGRRDYANRPTPYRPG